ncbi:MAG TPA: hypothetical protein VN749_17640 [Candidatus Eisenbacteria bacterium]|jgi:hypothetical protein|nr:hypothetical protein [Candidatus Eisenbacteria bacterium]
MVFGHNSNVAIGRDTVHVQTEDRGVSSALIDTTVHWRGRVLHRRTNNYKDLLPLDPGNEAELKTRVDEQHRAVMEELRSGALQVAIPKTPAPPPPALPIQARPVAPAGLKVDLTNSRTWLAGRNATLLLLVRDGNGNPVGNAAARARVEGAASPFEFAAETSPAGLATLQFEMPRLSGDEPALVIEVVHNGAKGQLRFQLRAKSKA